MIIFPAPPGSVEFTLQQYCYKIVISWTALSDNPCPITGYSITVGSSTETVDADVTNYNYPISDSDCGNTLQISVSAVNAAGTGSSTTNSIDVVCICEYSHILPKHYSLLETGANSLPSVHYVVFGS